jgi:Tol biopolymer transport system component
VTEDIELREILRATAEKAALPTVMPQPMRRKVALRRARTIGVTFLMTVAIAVGGLQGIQAITLDDAATAPTAPLPGDAVPKVDYVIDPNTGEMTPLPKPILRSLGKTYQGGPYAVSPDGSLLAYIGTGDGGSGQIFIARIDGTGVRQVTHDPEGVGSPAWSPDGTRIAYEGIGPGHIQSLFVLDVASGESTQITGVTRVLPLRDHRPAWPQFTPDGSSLLYTGGSDSHPVLRTVPVDGGKSSFPIGPRGNLRDAGNGSLSPDGSLVTFLGSGGQGGPEQRWGLERRYVANVDGTERRLLPDVYGIPCESNPAGTWSPDGSRIVCSEASRIIVIDIATGTASPVAVGREAIWLDDHTLLVSI